MSTATDPLTTPFALAEDAVARFREVGHVRLDGVADPATVAIYRDRIAEAVEVHARAAAPLGERDTYGRAFIQVQNLWREREDVAPFVLSPRFAGIARALLGVERVRLYHDQALRKEQGGGPTPWHQDQVYWPLGADTPTITMWMPLVDLGPDMGGMSFADGTQAGPLGDLGISDDSEAYFDRVVAERALRVSNHGPMRAGDATFHAGWTLHRAEPNRSTTTREVMTVIWFADGARLVEPQNGFHRHDAQMWVPGVRPGELAASELNPVVR